MPLFLTSSFNVHKESGTIVMEFMGGPDGKTFTFYVSQPANISYIAMCDGVTV